MLRKSIFLIVPAVFLAACGPAVETVETFDEQEEVVFVKQAVTERMVDVEQSTVSWKGAAIGKSHEGKIKLLSGTLLAIDKPFIGGSFVIDMNTITSDEKIEALEKHLKSEDFFDVVKYPEARLVITSVNETPGATEFTHMIEGNLEIKGTTKSLSFPATTVEEEGRHLITADFAINRSDWGVEYGLVGEKLVNDEIEFKISLIVSK